MMNAMKKAIMNRRSKFMPEADPMEDMDMGAMTDEDEAMEKDMEGESGLAPARDEEEPEIEIEEEGENKILESPEEDVLESGGPNMNDGGMSMGEGRSQSGLSDEELAAIADDLMRGTNKDKPSFLVKAAERMKGSIKR